MIDVKNETQSFICFISNCKKKEYGFVIEYKLSVDKKIEHCVYYSICHCKFSIILIHQMRNRNCNFTTDRIKQTCMKNYEYTDWFNSVLGFGPELKFLILLGNTFNTDTRSLSMDVFCSFSWPACHTTYKINSDGTFRRFRFFFSVFWLVIRHL